MKELLDKSLRLHELLLELDSVRKAELCKYHLVLDEIGINSMEYGFDTLMFFLVEIKTGRIVSSGNKREIARWIRVKKVDLKTILGSDLLSITTNQYFQSKISEKILSKLEHIDTPELEYINRILLIKFFRQI